MEIKLPFKFEQGDLVTCVGLTKDNPEKLVEGRTYAVVGVSIVDDGNVVYALKDYFGNLVYTMSEHLELLGNKKVSVVLDGQPLTENDPVNPNHYKNHKFEPIDVIEDWTSDLKGVQATDTGNIIKYIARWKMKNGLIDLKKIRWYIDHLIKNVEEKGVK